MTRRACPLSDRGVSRFDTRVWGEQRDGAKLARRRRPNRHLGVDEHGDYQCAGAPYPRGLAYPAAAARIGEEFRPQKVILFGSHAYGTASQDSDVDLLVVMDHEGTAWTQALEIVRRMHSRLPIDLLVRTPEQMRQRLAWNDFFLKEVTGRGEVLYESAHS